MLNLKTVLGIALVERSGRRIISNYNENGSLADSRRQRDFEESTVALLNTSFDAEATDIHVLVLQGRIVMTKVYPEFYIMIVSEDSGNEIILAQMLEVLQAAIEHFCGRDVTLKLVYQNYEEVVLILNEVFSNGLILTLNGHDLIDRVLLSNMKKQAAAGKSGKGGVIRMLGFA